VKRLVCLFDGTWNKPEDADLTNVVKLQRAIPAADAGGIAQVVHYEVGIATESALGEWSFAVGAMGFGVGSRIQGGYRFLCETYEEGDEIILVGFSRGAFEARSLAGLIALTGLARAATPETISDVWDCYERNKLARNPARVKALRAAARFPVRIKCVAVWDTIGNLGIPFVKKGLIKELLGFHDTELSPTVDVGLHALAIDEPRGTVKKGASLPPGQIVQQVWFPGCHANIGGGYKDCALSDIALLWMAERLTQTTGLALDLEHLRATTRPDPLGEQVSPTSDGVYRISRLLPFVRLIKQNRKGISAFRRAFLGSWRTSALPTSQVPVNESIHESASARFGKRVPQRRGEALREIGYRPRNLGAVLDK
jgi:uncharacterized protein (DUF2235 family)